jgi:hypothetical protein
MTQTLSTKKTPTERRIDFIGDCTKPINDRVMAQQILAQAGQPNLLGDLTLEEFTEIAVAMSQGKHLGRTDRWKAACDFAQLEIGMAVKNDGACTRQHARWAVVQGSVYMAHAAD